MTMDPQDIPDKTVMELIEDEDSDAEIRDIEEVRADLQDYYQARDELDTMIVASEQALEGVITVRELMEVYNSLYDDVEGNTLALDRL